jgi:hypothetical protein
MKNSISCIAFILVLLASCVQEPVIPISDTLKYSLGNEYDGYVALINKSATKDSISLNKFLTINDIFDGSSYEHGWVLVQLMIKIGDSTFYKSVICLTQSQKESLKGFFRAGLDGYGEINRNLPFQYPLTFNALGLNERDL